MLDWLVGRAVFANADGVMRPHVGDGQIHEGCEADSTTHEVGEHEERTTVGAGEAVGCDAVHDGAHGEFADTEVHVATEFVALECVGGCAFRQEGGLTLHVGVVRTCKVSRTTPEFRNSFGDRVEDCA